MSYARPYFLEMPRQGGQRFCLFHPARGMPRGLVLYLHPFAEEMNKARRMAALQSRAMAAAGFAVLQIDLLGCGDSSGDFGDALWTAWLDDGLQACQWLEKEHGRLPLWIWGLRAGSLLAVELAASLGRAARLLLWQPVLSGKQLTQQFLRLKLAAGLASGGVGKQTQAELLNMLAEQGQLEIAGYRLSAALVGQLEHASMLSPPTGLPNSLVYWFEMSSTADAELGPASRQAVGRWRDAGHAVHPRTIAGPGFWQTSEIEEAPALIEASMAALLRPQLPAAMEAA